MRGRSRSREHAEQGQAMVFLVLALTMLLAMSAFVIDVGYAYYVQRSLQSSADAAALAAAQDLPNADAAVETAKQYSGRPGAKNERANISAVTTSTRVFCRAGAPCRPFNSVEVKESAAVQTNFARVLGINTFNVTARAVAWQHRGRIPWAIFAYDSRCDGFGLKLNGNVIEVDGGIHSNGEFEANGMNIFAGYASSGGPHGCEPVIDGDHIEFGGSETPEYDPELLDWPLYFEESQFPCTYRRAQFTFNTNNETIPPGVYCATKSFEANANHQTGNITVLAPEIKIDGNNQQLTPYLHNVLFFATGPKDMTLNGNSYNWSGVIFHPRGRIKINGNADATLTGFIEGLEVEVNGNAFRMFGTGPVGADIAVALVE